MRYLCVECNRSLPPGTTTCPLDGAPVVGKPDDDDALLGTRIDGRFQIESIVGRGGMGTVFRGNQVSVGRAVAIKTLRPDLVRSDDAVRRFYREAKLVSRLNHPNVVSVVDFGATGDGVLYLVMELVQGRSLHRELLRGRIPLRRAVRIASQVCDALAEAHAIGIIHRDLKPDNILLTDHAARRDFVKVVDFGVATVVENGRRADTRITTVGGVVGTPAYMCPEQVSGAEALTPAADLYSLGLILFEMLTGRPPFSGDAPAQIMVAHATQAPPTLLAVAPDLDLPPHMEAFVARCLAKRPLERYADAPAFRRALEDAAAGRDHDPSRRSASDGYITAQPQPTQISPSLGSLQTGLAAALTEDDVRASSAGLLEAVDAQVHTGAGTAMAPRGGPITSVIGAATKGSTRPKPATELHLAETLLPQHGPQTVARTAAQTAVLASPSLPTFDLPAAELPNPQRARSLWPWVAGAAMVALASWGLWQWRNNTAPRQDSRSPSAAPAEPAPAMPPGPEARPAPSAAVAAPAAVTQPVAHGLLPVPKPVASPEQPTPLEPPAGARGDKTVRKRPKSNPFGLQ